MPGVSAITCEGVDEAVANEVVEVAAKGALDVRGVIEQRYLPSLVSVETLSAYGEGVGSM